VSQSATPLAIGSHAARVLAEGRVAVVVAVFSRAIYLDVEGAVVALVPADVPDGPLHVRMAELPLVEVGDVVRLGPRELDVSDRRWILPTFEWSPEPVPDILMAAPVVSTVVTHQPRLDLTAGASDLDHWLRPLLAEGDVEGACESIFGRGTGLTPVGDDIAAGILLVWALATQGEQPRLAAIAAGADTHEISRAFLQAAARGQSIEPIHSLIAAAARGDVTLARSELARLAQVGHTSGFDLAAGVRVALTSRVDCLDGRTPRETTSIHAHKVP
jgi:hypothetical protein